MGIRKHKFFVDMWYGDKKEDATSVDIWFSDADCVYRGNIYKGSRAIGDYEVDDSALLINLFPHLKAGFY